MKLEDFSSLEKQVFYLKGQLDSLKIDVNSLLSSSTKLELDLDILQKVNQFFSDLINDRLVNSRDKIEEIINKGLLFIFQDENISIRIDSVFKNNKTQFRVLLRDGHIESYRVLDSFGGGVSTVVAFLFRVVVNILFGNESFFVFDESLNAVSINYQESLSQFLRKLCEDMGITIVLITHESLMASNSNIVYSGYKDGGCSLFSVNSLNGDGVYYDNE